MRLYNMGLKAEFKDKAGNTLHIWEEGPRFSQFPIDLDESKKMISRILWETGPFEEWVKGFESVRIQHDEGECEVSRDDVFPEKLKPFME